MLQHDDDGNIIDKAGHRCNHRGYLIDHIGNICDRKGKRWWKAEELSREGEPPKIFHFSEFDID